MKKGIIIIFCFLSSIVLISGCNKKPLLSGSITVVVKASSVLEPVDDYSQNYVVDRDETTAWNEGKEGNGIGESITILYDAPVLIDRISIANGFQRTSRIYMNNHRIKEFDLFINGTKVGRYTFKDQMGFQDFKLPIPIAVSKLEIKIVSLYFSEKYDDTAISEIKIYNGDTEIRMRLRSAAGGASGTAQAVTDNPLMLGFADKNWKYLFNMYYAVNTETAQQYIDSGNKDHVSSNYITVRFDSSGKFKIYRAYADPGENYGLNTFSGSWKIAEAGDGWVKLDCQGEYLSRDTGRTVETNMILKLLVATEDALSYANYLDTYYSKYLKQHPNETIYLLKGFRTDMILPFEVNSITVQ